MASCKASYGSYCCVPWCTNGRTRKKPGNHFFRIPRDHRFAALRVISSQMSTEWVTYTRRADLMEKPVNLLYTAYKICSDHFTAQDFMDPGHTRLTKMAVPTVNSGAQWNSCSTSAILMHLRRG
nr:52 kDa repressor of the inhibitor of the protein kinase-like [Dermacentor andersoni]